MIKVPRKVFKILTAEDPLWFFQHTSCVQRTIPYILQHWVISSLFLCSFESTGYIRRSLKLHHHFSCFFKTNIKGYLCYKTILCHKVVLDVQLMNFFIWRKNLSFSRYQDFYVFMKFADCKTWDVIISITG